MDKPAAALAGTVGVLLFLMWQQFQKIAPSTVDGDIRTIILVAILAVGLSVYIQTNESR